jgi:hypothetical protein
MPNKGGRARRIITDYRGKEMSSFVQAPRIEVVLVPENVADVNRSTATFDIWLVLHLPSGDPETIRVDDGPFSRDDAVHRMSEIWMDIGARWAEETAKFGSAPRVAER